MDKNQGIHEIKLFIDEDATSVKKHFARIGERYFDGDHDIKNYRMFYFNSDGQLVEDTSRANVRIPHPFFKELTEQGTQYTLSGSDGFVFSDVPELQSELDARFNNNDDFIDELSETLTDCQTKGFAYMYNLIDFDHPLYAVKGFEGDNLDELQQNLKTKKIVGVGSDGGIEVHTVDVPYEARKVKLELDEKNIYRFGMGLNLSGLKDTSATTNIAIKAAYSLLDLRCKHLERNIKRFLRKIVTVCIDEINQQNGTDYQITDVYFEFTHEVMSNEQENEQNELTEAQKQQVQINTLLSLAQIFGDDLTIQYICDVLDIDYEDVKDKLPDNEADKVQQVQDDLNSIIPDDEGGGIGEQGTEGSTTGTA